MYQAYLKHILNNGGIMPKKLVTFDDATFKFLDGSPNASEFIRQAIKEKLARDKNAESSNEDTKEFMRMINKLNKLLDQNNQRLDKIEKHLVGLDVKFHFIYTRMKRFFTELIYGLLKINVMGAHLVGSDWLDKNKEGIDEYILPELERTIERVESNEHS